MKRTLVGIFASVALIFAAGSMLVSCNDYDEDFYAQFRNELANQDATLRDLLNSEVEALQAQLDALKAAQQECKANCEKKQAELQAAIDALAKALQDSDAATNQKLAEIDNEINGLKTEISYLKTQDELFKKSLDVLTEAIDSIRARGIENSNSILVINTQITDLYQKVAAAQALAQQGYDEAVKAARQAGANAEEIEKLRNAQTTLNEKFELMQASWDDQFQKLTATANSALDLAVANKLQIENLKDEDVKINAKLQELIKNVGDNTLAITHLGHRIDDLETEVGELDSQLEDLTDRVEELEAAVAKVDDLIAAAVKEVSDALTVKMEEYNAALNGRIDGVETEVGELSDALDALDLKVSDLQTAYDNLDTKLNNEVTKLQNEINALLNRLTNIFSKYISGIVLQGSENQVTGSLSLPVGVNSQVLALFYGEAATSAVVFPCFDEYACLVDAEMAMTEDDEKVLGGFANIPGSYTVPMGTKLMNTDEGNAGTLYLTVNPSDVDFTNTSFELVNSLDETSAIKLSPLTKSDKLLKFGYTRAENGFYETKATLDIDDIDKVTMDFDFEQIRQVVKDALDSEKAFNITNTYMTLENLFADVLDASGVRATWNDGVATHSVYSQYGIAATAVKPLSFAFLYGQKGFDLPHISPLSELDMHLDQMALVEIDDDLQLVYTIDGVTYTSDAFEELIGQINERIAARFTNKINKLIQEIGDQANKNFNKYLDLVNGYINRINSNNIVNRVYDIFENPNNYLQPTLVYESTDGICYQVSNEKYVPSVFFLDGEGEQGVRLIPTSFNAEIFAPAYKKFIAVTNVFTSDFSHSAQKYVVDNSGDADDKLCADALELANSQDNFNSVFEGRTDVAFVTDSKYEGLVYEIAYSALDYSGRVAGNKYYVKVK
ncbi:MAG: hypothetical protein J5814_06375 [Bacteroidaceae bacterium]|nr:hypothetical protein [Bacteroidaceae bacterium]